LQFTTKSRDGAQKVEQANIDSQDESGIPRNETRETTIYHTQPVSTQKSRRWVHFGQVGPIYEATPSQI